MTAEARNIIAGIEAAKILNVHFDTLKMWAEMGKVLPLCSYNPETKRATYFRKDIEAIAKKASIIPKEQEKDL